MEADSHAALTGIAAVALAALACGIAMTRLRQPAIVGYILAGVLLGPSGLRLVADRGEIHDLAELGVLMLLFLIGMELSLRNFRHIWKVAVGVTAIQIGVGVGIMMICARLFDWSLPMALLLGFVVALSSTAVAVKILEDMGELRTHTGRIAVGVLVAQDLAVVPMILTINGLAGDGFDWMVLPKILLSIGFLVVLILYLSAGRKIHLPFLTLVAGNVDLKPLSALAFCFCIAAFCGFAGLSAAYGAFLAGLVIGNSAERHEMVAVTQPIQSILMMVFFLSVGLLLDLDYLWQNLGAVLFLFFLVAVVKTALNVSALGLFGQSWQHAFLAGIMLAQIGEFSFVLAGIGAGKGVIGEDERRLIAAVTVLSLALSPLYVLTGRRLQKLAQDGVTESRQLLRMVYAPEAEAIQEAAGEALTRAQRQRRLLVLWIRRRRLARKRGQAAKEAAQRAKETPAVETATAAEPSAEAKPTLPEQTNAPANDVAGAEAKKDDKPAAKKDEKPAPKKEAKPASKPEPKPAPKADAKPAPKANAKSATKKAEAAPKKEETSAEKAETKSAPKKAAKKDGPDA